MDFELMSKIIDELAKMEIGIQWTGGEPLFNPYIIDGINYASTKKINQCLFTNGLLLTQEIVENILRTNLKFVRVSLNAVSKDVHAKFHGYPVSKEYITEIIRNINYFALRKNELKSKTLLGISIVYDQRNAMDIENVLNFINNLQIKSNGNAVDYVIIRPAFKIYNNIVMELDNRTKFHLESVITSTRNVMNTKLIYSQINNTLQSYRYFQLQDTLFESNKCLSYGWFSEILPTGEILLCSDLTLTRFALTISLSCINSLGGM